MNTFGYIYKITNLINGKIYIGQTINPISQRFTEHISNALNGKISYLCYAIRKYGAINFTLALLETCNSLNEMNGYEIKYIVKYDSFSNGYNMTLGGAGRSGYEYKVSKKTRKKISEANKRRFKNPENHPMYGKHPIAWNKGKKGIQVAWNKGIKMSDEFKGKCSKAKKGNIPWNKGLPKEQQPRFGNHLSDKTKEKIRQGNLGKKISKETRKKLSEANLGKNHPNYGKHLSNTTKEKLRQANLGKKLSDEHKRKISQSHLGKKHSDEVRKILSIKAKAQWAKVKLNRSLL